MDRNEFQVVSHRKLDCHSVAIEWFSYDSVSSTMDVAKSLIMEGHPPWTVITAATQTRGRGTHGRDWFSLRGGGLYISAILPLPGINENLEHLTVKTAAVTAGTLLSLYNLRCTIKHPNDLYAGGKKLAGILYESASLGEQMTSIVLGMGINLYQTRENFDAAGLPDATSVFIETNIYPEPETILTDFLYSFVPMYRTVSG